MEIYFSPYSLSPLVRSNHLTDLSPKKGVYLRTDNPELEVADYFPHIGLGDQTLEMFLESFPNFEHPYHQSILRQLGSKKTEIHPVPFLNHQFWQEGAKVEAPVVKYKIMHKDDLVPDEILKSTCRIRLDANGIFEGKEIFKFLSRMDIQQIARIDYIEDPSRLSSWSDIPIPTAKDFIENRHFQTLIYKPNRCFKDDLPSSTIFSGYMGSQLGVLHAYRELLARGDLTKYHGLLTPGIYAEERTLFCGDFQRGFIPDPKAIAHHLAEVHDQPWSHLCSL
jgi:hypothetical protein